MRPALFLDLDSTVRYTSNPNKPCPNKPSDVLIYPGVVDKIKNFKEAGFYVFGVSNQGGIGLGYITEETCKSIMDTTDAKMDNVFDEILWAPDMVSDDRKPNPGMIHKLTKKYEIDLTASIMVGDKVTDQQCSDNANVGTFFFAKDFFIEGHSTSKSTNANLAYVDLMR